MQLLCSTGAFSRYPDYTDYRAVLTYGPLLAVDGFELMFYPHWAESIDEIADALRASGLRFPALHAEKSIGTALGKSQPEEIEQGLHMLEVNCRLARALNTPLLVLHLWGWPELDDDIERNLRQLGRCLDLADHYGLELAVETIPVRRHDPLGNVRRAITRDARAQIALDTEFLAHHGQLEEALDADWLWQDARVRHIHIKDYDHTTFSGEKTRRYLHPGEGDIAFAPLFATLKTRDFSGNISLEASALSREGHVNIEQLHRSLNSLRQHIHHA